MFASRLYEKSNFPLTSNPSAYISSFSFFKSSVKYNPLENDMCLIIAFENDLQSYLRSIYPMASLIFFESSDYPKFISFFFVVSSSIGEGGLGFSGAVMSA